MQMIPSNLNIAMIPLEITWKDKSRNLDQAAKAIRSVHPDTDLIILPEMFSTGFITGDKEEIRTLAERNTGTTIDTIKALAAENHVAISGSFIADSGGALYNRAFFIEPGGEEYFADKKHLFTPAGESKVFSRGYNRMSIRFRGWNIAMIVCYDIRFPVWCRNKQNEYDLLIAVANWPDVRINAWNQLLSARAIENLSYVCGVNCKGKDIGGFIYGGEADTYDFKGKNISVRDSQKNIVYSSLDYKKLNSFREKFPAWMDADDFKIC